MDEKKSKIADEFMLEFYDGEHTKIQEIKDIKDNCVSMIEGLQEGKKVHKIYSGISHLDNSQNGYDTTDYIVLAAGQSTGKTSYVLSLILQQIKNNIKVGFFTCEMKKQKIVNLLSCSLAGIDCNKYELNQLSNAEKDKIISVNERLYEKPLYIDDSTRDWDIMKKKIKYAALVKECDIIYIDYLQYLRTKRARTLYDRLEIVSQEIKDLAKAIETPIVTVAALNREGKKAERPPTANDLKGNSDIEYDADKIILMHTLQQAIDGDYSKRLVEFIVDKNRNGKLGKYRMEFNCALRRFEKVC